MATGSRWLDIDFDELSVMMAISGIKRVYGFDMVERAPVTKRDMNRILWNLHQQGLVVLERNVVKISDGYKHIFGTIKDAEILVTSVRENGSKVLSYIYGDEAVIAMRDSADGRRIKIMSIDRDGFPGAFLGQCVDYRQAPADSAVMYVDDETEGTLLASFEKTCMRDGKKVDGFRLMERGLFPYVVRDDGEGGELQANGFDAAKSILGEWTGDRA